VKGHVVQYAEHPGGKIDDRGAVLLQVEKTHRIHGRGISCQERRGGIHQGIPDADLVACRASDLRLPFPQRVHGECRDGVQEDIHRPRAVEIVVHGCDGVSGRDAVKKIERTDRGIHLGRGGNRCGDVGGHFQPGRLRRKRCHARYHESGDSQGF